MPQVTRILQTHGDSRNRQTPIIYGVGALFAIVSIVYGVHNSITGSVTYAVIEFSIACSVLLFLYMLKYSIKYTVKILFP